MTDFIGIEGQAAQGCPKPRQRSQRMGSVTTTLEALKLGRVGQQAQSDALALDAVRVADFAHLAFSGGNEGCEHTFVGIFGERTAGAGASTYSRC